MKDLSQRRINKPQNLAKYDLIAIHGTYDVPTSPDVMNPKYSKSELAVNEGEGLVQVYVSSHDKDGLQKFKQDYPNAVIQQSAALDHPDEWRVVAFTSEAMPDETTALDNYFQGRGREYIQLTAEKIRKDKEKKHK